jgi:hypothetical protein
MSLSQVTEKVEELGLSVPKTAFYRNVNPSAAQPKTFVVLFTHW